MSNEINRRQILRGSAALGGGVFGASALFPAWAQSQIHGLLAKQSVLSGTDIALHVGHSHFSVDGRPGHAITVNGTVPAPLIRLREGQDVRITVTNSLDEDTSIHWHGLILPFQMDGVPGLSFPGIKPQSSFTYSFPIRQSGTYWYHSHSGLQEQMGHYGPIVIDPAGPDPVQADREYILVLSDWSFVHPHILFKKMKQQPGYFNYQKQTLQGLLSGKDQPLSERLQWGAMRMDPADVSDITGATYHYLINGHGPKDNWTALFIPGERVRLRIINAAAMTNFNIRIPGLSLSVVQADGLHVRPVLVDELQIAIAETYDVVVTPTVNRAFSFVAEAVDRSGMARATLTPDPMMTAEPPKLRARPLATMKDMGMGAMDHAGMDHGNMRMRDPANAPLIKMEPGVQTISPMPVDRLGEPGQGLEDVDHKVLVYTDLIALDRNPDTRKPTRSLQLHLTGNMERFMWSFNGEKYSEVTKPIPFRLNERVRVTLVNDSMMAHPIHLHGHFFELVTGHGEFSPRKHTVNVLPGGKASFDLTANAPGDWAFHCHMLYHMHAGMFRVVTVRPVAEVSA